MPDADEIALDLAVVDLRYAVSSLLALYAAHGSDLLKQRQEIWDEWVNLGDLVGQMTLDEARAA
jgi:polyhydroxyalkanoate synthesis regulator phasin